MDTSRQTDIKRLVGNPSLGNLVEHFQVKGDLVFPTMIKVKPRLRILKIIVTNISVKTNRKSLLKNIRNALLRMLLVLTIYNLDGLHNCIIYGLVLTELFGVV